MIYLDSCLLIYATEDGGDRGMRSRALIADHDTSDLLISPLVELECLVRPLRDGDLRLRDDYVRLFRRFRRLEPDRDGFLRAAELRAAHGLQTVDALHVATAQLAGCDALWTNDDRLAGAIDIAVNVLAA